MKKSITFVSISCDVRGCNGQIDGNFGEAIQDVDNRAVREGWTYCSAKQFCPKHPIDEAKSISRETRTAFNQIRDMADDATCDIANTRSVGVALDLLEKIRSTAREAIIHISKEDKP
jgi:hypothetical protein